MQHNSHILVVDDDLETRRLLARYLSEQGFQVSTAFDSRSMKEILALQTISLVVLDVLLPDASGLDICRDLRRDDVSIPIILLTALKEDVDRIIGLEIGADDYLSKPFNPRELVARIRAVLRRKLTQDVSISRVIEFRFAGFTLRPLERCIFDQRMSIVDVTAAEFDLLIALLRKPGQLLSRDTLIAFSNREANGSFDRSIDVAISRLRKKLGDSESNQIIQTVRSGGYIFCAALEILGSEA
jgi:two-component system OmpR family response regulator